jgi:hypothetical protein
MTRSHIAGRVAIVLALAPVMAEAQRGGSPPAPQPPRLAAPIDLTGYWVTLVTEDWRYRVATPRKGDYGSVPLNPAGRKAADAWDPARDQAAVEQCKAYGVDHQNWLFPCDDGEQVLGRAPDAVPSYLFGQNPFVKEYRTEFELAAAGHLGGAASITPEIVSTLAAAKDDPSLEPLSAARRRRARRCRLNRPTARSRFSRCAAPSTCSSVMAATSSCRSATSDEHEAVEYRDMVVIVRDRIRALVRSGATLAGEDGAADGGLRYAVWSDDRSVDDRQVCRGGLSNCTALRRRTR